MKMIASRIISMRNNRIQNEFQISNAYIGYLASTLYFGMCMGSFFWGRVSDVVGRKFPFTLTLTIGGVSGLIGTFIGSFGWLLVVMFCLGFGIGGNIPVDGAILAEFLPLSHRGRTMVSLSVFWALGEFVACLIAWLIVPENICPTNENGCETVIFDPAQGCPAPFTICATIDDIFPFVSGLAITEISPPSKLLKLNFGSNHS